MKKVLLGSLLCAVSLVGTSALAEEQVAGQGGQFASQGQMILGAERLFGFYYQSFYAENDDSKKEESISGPSIQFLWNGDRRKIGSTSADVDGMIPRLAFDYAVIDGLTVGGSLGLSFSSGEYEEDPGGKSDEPSTFTFMLAPRVGYAIMFDEQFGIWPRAGFRYVYSSWEQEGEGDAADSEASGWILGMNVDAMFVYTPVPHLAIMAGPLFDIGLTGSLEVNKTDFNIRSHTIGLTAGVAGYF